ncbi:hypothetical protein ACHHYP_09203 [Achlya hypogyna]|uniref:Uncharacterized protein n=1 Tax=Achlya hypogyna TaxID=1202772 RepID=A0A1V9ZJB1_ACHHY|nr:hypothetical protein ACHHYP_09203 [Achlya hypogyna]
MATGVLLNGELLATIAAFQDGLYLDVAPILCAWRSKRSHARTAFLIDALQLTSGLRLLQRFVRCLPDLFTSDVLDHIVHLGHLDAYKYIVYHLPMTRCSPNALNMAVAKGHLNLVAFLHAQGTKSWTEHTLDLASESGHFDIVRFLHTLGLRASTYAMDAAAAHGNLAIVRFLHEHRREGCTTDAMDRAAANGHMNVVRFLHSHRHEGCTRNAMDAAAGAGHLEIVAFLHRHRTEGCTTRAMDQAAGNGHMDVVKFLHIHRVEGATKLAIDTAAAHGHVDVVRFLVEHRREGWRDAVCWARRSQYCHIVSFLEAH